MKKKPGDFFSSLKSFILPENYTETKVVTNNLILSELIECFDRSCHKESVGTSLLFNMHFLVIMHPDTYEERLPSLPVIVKEAVKEFYRKLEVYKKGYDDISPVSYHWHFKFGPGTEFNQERVEREDLKVIGMLTGLKNGAAPAAERHGTTKVTMKSKVTNVFDKMDLNIDVLRHIHFAESGTFQVKFHPELRLNGTAVSSTSGTPGPKQTRSFDTGMARIEYFMADTKTEASYIMKDTEIVIARKESENEGYSNYLLIDSGFVSNPHARIRLNEPTGRFQIASFSRNETRVNEKIINKSDPSQPEWFDLDNKSQVLLNSIVTLKFTII